MADHSQKASHEFCNSFGLGSVCKVCKSFVSKFTPDRLLSPNKKTHHNNNKDPKPKSTTLHDPKVSIKKTVVDKALNDVEEFRYSEGTPASGQQYYYTSSPKSSPPGSRSTSPSRLVRTISRIFRTTSVKHHNVVVNGGGGGGIGSAGNTPAFRSTLSRNTSSVDTQFALPKTFSRSTSLQYKSTVEAPATLPTSFSRNASRRSTTPIMFSSSTGLVKPPPMEETLECTLEELCFGCVKQVKITRDAVTENGITVEDGVLTIKVKPGWTKGTKITFEGKGNERPGTSPGDVMLVIAEKRHPLFRREGDNLELAVEIPLVKALTGGTISIPLLSGETMNLNLDDIIYPGYEKIIVGQGMPKPKEEGNRGNLIVTFLVAFPTELTEEQRSDVVRILDGSC